MFRSRLLKYGENFSVKTGREGKGRPVSEHAIMVHRRSRGLLHSLLTSALDGEVSTSFHSSRCTQEKMGHDMHYAPEPGWVL
jgi:hypothetical protein